MKPLPRNEKLKDFSQELRREQTPAESRIWFGFLRRYRHQIRRQRVIGNCIVDFYCHDARLAIEVDGGYHDGADQDAYDKERDELLSEYGIAVLRISNDEILQSFGLSCGRIDSAIKERTEYFKTHTPTDMQ